MRIGIMGNQAYSVAARGPYDVEALVEDARRAQRDGMASYWVGQQFDWDAFSLLAALVREVPDIEFGTAVTHLWTAFPVHMAQQAMSLQVLSGGRFTLGIGLEHEWVIRQMWGLDWDRPVSRFEEYLEIVRSLLWTGSVDLDGRFFKVKTAFLRFAPQPDMQVILAALGPRMLKLAAEEANGTTTWLTGPKTIATYVIPTIRHAAEAAERPPPRVIPLMPIAVTRDVAAMRERVSEEMAIYHRMPSYQAMLEREGVKSAGETGLFGSRDEVEEALGRLADAGATDFGAILFGDDDEQEATRELLTDASRANASQADASRAGAAARPTRVARPEEAAR
jgi:5,10-methylenetetrahydromethanopterin reductase